MLLEENDFLTEEINDVVNEAVRQSRVLVQKDREKSYLLG